MLEILRSIDELATRPVVGRESGEGEEVDRRHRVAARNVGSRFVEMTSVSEVCHSWGMYV